MHDWYVDSLNRDNRLQSQVVIAKHIISWIMDVKKKWFKKELHTKIRVDPVFTLELKIPSTDDSHTQKRAACQEIFIEKDTIKHFFLQPFFIHVGITTEKIWKKKRGILQLYF